MMAFRKQAALALALATTIICFGCADGINAPNTTDEQPVLPPTNVTATISSDGVRVTWDASSEPTINGYNLYRREVGNGDPKRLNSTRILTTLYVDGGVAAPKHYEYRVTAVNSNGKESHFVAVVIETPRVLSGKLPDPTAD